ncbi:hypothetical protein DSUL_50040 [Desulfovibrionales bacterium]
MGDPPYFFHAKANAILYEISYCSVTFVMLRLLSIRHLITTGDDRVGTALSPIRLHGYILGW